MPADHRIDLNDRIVYSRAWGILSDEDLLSNNVAADPAFAPDLRQLYDLTDVTEIAVTAAGLRALAATSRFAPTARRAIVVSSDVVFGMSRMYAIISGHEEWVRVFRDRAAALAWLTDQSGSRPSPVTGATEG